MLGFAYPVALRPAPKFLSAGANGAPSASDAIPSLCQLSDLGLGRHVRRLSGPVRSALALTLTASINHRLTLARPSRPKSGT